MRFWIGRGRRGSFGMAVTSQVVMCIAMMITFTRRGFSVPVLFTNAYTMAFPAASTTTTNNASKLIASKRRTGVASKTAFIFTGQKQQKRYLSSSLSVGSFWDEIPLVRVGVPKEGEREAADDPLKLYQTSEESNNSVNDKDDEVQESTVAISDNIPENASEEEEEEAELLQDVNANADVSKDELSTIGDLYSFAATIDTKKTSDEGKSIENAEVKATNINSNEEKGGTTTTEKDQQPILEEFESNKRKRIPKKFVPFPFEYHQELTLRVQSLTNLGKGILRANQEDILPSVMERIEKQQQEEENEGGNNNTGSKKKKKQMKIDMDRLPLKNWVIMVDDVIPGELVKVRIYRNQKTYSEADLIEIIESKDEIRQEPKCPLFKEGCGGCQYQHMTIDYQREWKQKHVHELLTARRGVDFGEVLPTLGTDEIYHYRSKITPHYDAPKNRKQIGAIGFQIKSSRKLLDIPFCYIAQEPINDKLKEVRQDLQERCEQGRLKKKNKGATLLFRYVDNNVEGGEVITDPKQYVETNVAGLTFRFMAGNFFQNNPYMLPIMVDKVKEASMVKSSSTNQPMTHLIDCYCGSGLFALSNSPNFEKCVGIEINEKAILDCEMNAKLNNIENCEFISASADKIFGSEKINEFSKEQTVVIIDPPRKGCSEEFLEQLLEFGPQRLVYMSCDPATQARDAEFLLSSSSPVKYEIISVQPFDLFPQTRHIENLMVFERKDNRENNVNSGDKGSGNSDNDAPQVEYQQGYY